MTKISKVKPEDVKSSIGTTTTSTSTSTSTTTTTTLEEKEGYDMPCEEKDCDYVAKGKTEDLTKNYLNQHSKKHGEKKKSWADGGHVMKSEGEDIA